MQYARRLIESRPFLTRVPDQTLLASDPGKGTDHIQATRGEDGSYAFVYSASGKPFTLDLRKLSGKELKAWWYAPRNGTATAAGSFARTGQKELTPPSAGKGNDLVLVVDDVDKKYTEPGEADR